MLRIGFHQELIAYRARQNKAASALVVMRDADTKRVEERISELEASCQSVGVAFRMQDESVAIGIPKRNIETWIHYLNDNQVNEQEAYPKLGQEKRCKPAVDRLVQVCQANGLENNAPQSLILACEEYNNRLRPMG